MVVVGGDGDLRERQRIEHNLNKQIKLFIIIAQVTIEKILSNVKTSKYLFSA